VRDDRERSPPRDIANEICRESRCIHRMEASACAAAKCGAQQKQKAAGRQGQAAK
jgi:hypothetical protein